MLLLYSVQCISITSNSGTLRIGYPFLRLSWTQKSSHVFSQFSRGTNGENLWHQEEGCPGAHSRTFALGEVEATENALLGGAEVLSHR